MSNWRWILNLTCRRWDVLYFAYWLSGRANFVQGQQFPMSQWLAKKLPNTWRVGGLGGGRVSTHFFAQAVDYIFCLCIGTREAKWEQRVNKPQEFVLCSHHHMYMKRWGQEKMCYSPHHNMFIPSRLFLLEEKKFWVVMPCITALSVGQPSTHETKVRCGQYLTWPHMA